MIQEEAVQEYINEYTGCFEDGIEIISKIYDDFKNRTCENCKYFKVLSINGEIKCKYFGTIKCDKEFNYDFGCNKWVKKEMK